MDINPGRAMKEAVARPPRLASLAPVAGLLAVASCYGTLGVVALLSVIGVAVPLNEVLLVRIVTVVLAIALLGMAYSFRMHRDIKPSLLGIASAALLFWVFYGEYSRPLEALGFAGLMAASLWDFRAKHRACPAKPGAEEENASCP